MLEEIIRELKGAQHILLTAHTNPDGDALGALAGMGHLCSFLGVPYTILLEEFPNKFLYIMSPVNVSDTFKGDYDTFVSVDCGDMQRFDKYASYYHQAKITINIDHHHTNESFALFNYVEKDASSASELVYNIAKLSGMKMTKEFAEAIYTGIVSDTGGFMYSSTKPSTHRVAAELIEIGFDFTSIYHSLMHLKTEKSLKLQSIALNHLVKLNSDEIFLSYISQDDLVHTQASKDDISGIVSFIKNIEGCKLAGLIYPQDFETYKISLRSVEPYDVAAIAQSFGGGGHIRAAGASVKGTLEDILSILKQKLELIEK